MILKFIYTVFIGILLVLFVGFGIAAFYPEPKYPEMPISQPYPAPMYPKATDSAREAQMKQAQQQIKAQNDYQANLGQYNKNVSIILLCTAILYLIISLLLAKQLLLISDGLLLGGIFTLMYGLVSGFGSNDTKFQFIIVSVGLVISLVLGYIKFIKPRETIQSEKKFANQKDK